MSGDNSACPICNVVGVYTEKLRNYNLYYYECANCGNFVISARQREINKDIYAHFLYHNKNNIIPIDDREIFYFLGDLDTYNHLVKRYPYSILLKVEALEAWYPKNLSERTDYILTFLANISDYPGREIEMEFENIKSLFFVNRFSNNELLPLNECNKQIDYISSYMLSQNLLKKELPIITILPEGWRRIAELQRNNPNSIQAFIAMSFSREMSKVQEAIENAIIKAGYFLDVMNKSEHNNQIVPEILYQIKQSKFVVAEFSTNNNGAYYEAGYAAGLGKEVIHICNNKKSKVEEPV
jgi:hypothetical protein